MKHTFNINTDEFVELTNRLEKLNKSAMPITVRGTLNDLAFDMKKNELFKSFDNQFIIRKKSFIRSQTGINKCKNTFDIQQMTAKVGVLSSSKSKEGLRAQEIGGNAPRTDYLPYRNNKGKTPARISSSHEKRISKNKKVSELTDVIKITGGRNPFKNKKFRRAAFKGGKGTYINYNGFVGQIKKVKTRPLDINFEVLYKLDKNKKVQIDKAPWLSPASAKSYKKVLKLFKERAKRKMKL